jgi:hypothetical protein
MMTKRIQKLAVAVAAFAALALGGAVFAQAQSSPAGAPERTSVPDRDNVQSGDQTAPDVATSRTARHHAVRATAERPGAENPEQTGAESESAPGSDGPGGHADEPGNPSADHQFQGNE